MEQLLNISSVPINIEVNVTRAELKQDSEAPKVQIDNTAARESLSYGFKNIDTFTKDDANEEIKVAYQAVANTANTANTTNEGNARTRFEATPASIAASKATRTLERLMDFLPKDSPTISWSSSTLNINYKTDELKMGLDVHTDPKLEFVPGDIEFIVNQLPKLEIEYVGEPIYFPRSAAPGYDG